MKHPPKLDPEFIPFGLWREAYLKNAKKPIAIALERNKDRISVHHTFIHGTEEMREADFRYVERYVKFLLWSIGGFRIYICGCSELEESLSPAEKLKVVQELMAQDDPRAIAIFQTIGAYLAYTVVLYSQFYNIEHMMVLGRVMSGKGGDIILEVCNQILRDEFPALAAGCNIYAPDENSRRVGQSVAAASLPQIK